VGLKLPVGIISYSLSVPAPLRLVEGVVSVLQLSQKDSGEPLGGGGEGGGARVLVLVA
jgi:hypothetical protein